MGVRQFTLDQVRRLGWALFLLGSSLGNTTVGLLLLFVDSVLRCFRHRNRSSPVEGQEADSEEVFRDPFFYAAYAFLGAALLSVLGSRHPDIALLTAVGFLLVVHLILRGSVDLVGSAPLLPLRKFVPWTLGIGLVGTAYAVLSGLIRGDTRIGGWLGPNGLGGLSAFYAVIATAYVLSERRAAPRFLGAVAGLVQLAGLALSLSRGAWLGFLASIGVWATLLLPSASRQDRRRFAFVTAAVLMLAIVAVVTYPPLTERALRVVNLDKNMDRIYIWSAAWRMFADNPLTGIGGGNFPFVYADYRPEGDWRTNVAFAHNLLLHVLAEYGLVGLVPFVWMIGTALRRGWLAARRGDLMLQAVYAGYIGFIAHDMVDNVTHGMNIGGLFWLVTGLLVRLGRGSRHRSGAR